MGDVVQQFIEELESRRLLATSGLNASYFNNQDYTGSVTSRIDKQVAFTALFVDEPVDRILA